MLFTEISPYDENFLSVSNIHTIYYEQSGNPEGLPIVFLHGGPGSGTDPNHRRYFDPKFYRIILLDQRGCGKSTPHACIEENTTFDLIEDLDKLRRYLKIEKWVVFGGSWGSLLAMSYAVIYPKTVIGIILRGIFFCSSEEMEWFYYTGAPKVFPESYEQLLSLLEEDEDILKGYHRLINSEDQTVALKASKAWSGYEARALKLKYDPEFSQRVHDPKKSLAIAKIETHYFFNKGFFPDSNWLFDRLNILNSLPIYIVHGRYDMVCPVKNAFTLKKHCPHVILSIIEDAGHAGSEPGILEELIKITNITKFQWSKDKNILF